MPFFERARDFVARPDSERMERLLWECVSAGNLDGLTTVQFLAEHMYGGHTFDLEFKARAAWCLIAWEDRGLRALLEMAQRTQTTKNYSLCVQILATFSAREHLPKMWLSEELRDFVDGHISNWENVYTTARVKLNELALSFSSDDDAALYVALPIPVLSSLVPSAVKPLFLAMSTRWLSVGPATIAKYEELLRSASGEEPALHHFFEGHPELLDPMALDVWSKPNLRGAAQPDFVIRRMDDTYLVVEIETPGKTLVTGDVQLGAQTTHAIAQALRYREFLTERSSEASMTFPQFRTPDCLVVIGMEKQLNPEQRRLLRLENGARSGVSIVGFDWLAERARTLAQNVVESRIEARRVRMT